MAVKGQIIELLFRTHVSVDSITGVINVNNIIDMFHNQPYMKPKRHPRKVAEFSLKENVKI